MAGVVLLDRLLQRGAIEGAEAGVELEQRAAQVLSRRKGGVGDTLGEEGSEVSADARAFADSLLRGLGEPTAEVSPVDLEPGPFGSVQP